MPFDLVLDVGNSTVGGAFFENDALVESFHLPSRPLSESAFKEALKKKNVKRALIGADNLNAGHIASSVLKEKKIPHAFVDSSQISVILDVEAPQEVGADRIANTYGALYAHPHANVIVIDMGTAVTFDVIAKERRFLGGAIYPGLYLSAKALSQATDKLPLIPIEKPKSCLSRSTIGNIQSGLYYGLLGTIERILKEIKTARFAKSKVVVVATGGLTAADHPDSFLSAHLRSDLEQDLKGIVDYFEPDLTFLGLHQILKERKQE